MSGAQSESTQRYAVIGSSVEKSVSPPIHKAFAKSMGFDLCYERLTATEAEATQVIRDFFASGGKGLSVTMPLKSLVYELADERHPRAVAVGAANTLSLRSNGSIVADNTDGLGLFDALHRLLGWSWRDQRVLLIGAGGAASAILPAILAGRPSLLAVANRSSERARLLVQATRYRKPNSPVEVVAMENQPVEAYDLIIHATAAGLMGQLPGISVRCIGGRTKVYDISYGERAKLFLDWCLDQGAACCEDGLSMLMAQAAYQYLTWHKVMPDVAALRANWPQIVR